jgi:hypothetical protein
MTQTDLVAWINVGTHHLVRALPSAHTRTHPPPARRGGLAEHAHEHRGLVLLPHAAQLLRQRRLARLDERRPAHAPQCRGRAVRVDRVRCPPGALRACGAQAVRLRGPAGVRVRRCAALRAGHGGPPQGGGAVPPHQGRAVGGGRMRCGLCTFTCFASKDRIVLLHCTRACIQGKRLKTDGRRPTIHGAVLTSNAASSSPSFSTSSKTTWPCLPSSACSWQPVRVHFH